MKNKTEKRAELTAGGEKKLMVWGVLFTVVIALVDALFFYPLLQITRANIGSETAFQITDYLVQFVNLFCMFAMIGVLAAALYFGSAKVFRRTLVLEAVSFICISSFLKGGVYYLLAFIDSKSSLSFYFCNDTLSMITEDGGLLFWTLLGSNILTFAIYAVFIAASCIGIKALAKSGAPDGKYAIAVALAYFTVGILNAVVETVMSVADAGAPQNFGEVAELALPYFVVLIFASVGYIIFSRIYKSIRDSAE